LEKFTTIVSLSKTDAEVCVAIAPIALQQSYTPVARLPHPSLRKSH
jgi:hypothetical protein